MVSTALTEEEYRLINQTGDLMNAFMKLPVEHKADISDFVFHIHALQNVILSRVGLRELREKEKWTVRTNELRVTGEELAIIIKRPIPNE